MDGRISDRGKDGIHDQWADRLALLEEHEQDLQVAFARIEDAGDWLGKPRRDRGFRHGCIRAPMSGR